MDDGGVWREAPKAEVDEAMSWHAAECAVERRQLASLSKSAFRRDYVETGTPVILHCGEGERAAAASCWAQRQVFSRRALLGPPTGDFEVKSGRSALIKLFNGNGYNRVTLGAFIRSMRDATSGTEEDGGAAALDGAYVFDRGFILGRFEHLRRAARIPRMVSDSAGAGDFSDVGGAHTAYLLLGTNSSGVTFHRHGSSLLGQLFGHKRVFLLPPWQDSLAARMYGVSMADWAQRWLPLLRGPERPQTCLLRPGDLLFIPPHW